MAKNTPLPSPFPDLEAPSAAACRAVLAALVSRHGQPRFGQQASEEDCGRVDPVLEALVRTILSQNTTNANSRAAMERLTEHFAGDWQRVADAPRSEVVACLRRGGLANVKAARIQKILASVRAEHGGMSLEHLRGLSDQEVHRTLTRYPGVGHKTASCVLLFCLRRPSFAVDTHVHRLARRLGWAPAHASRDQVFHHLEARVPAPLKYALHVLLVRHGQTCARCRAREGGRGRPRDALLPCPLASFWATAGAPSGGGSSDHGGAARLGRKTA